MGGGGRGMFAQHVPFDLEAFVPPFTFFFLPTFAPVRGLRGEFSFSLQKQETEDITIILNQTLGNTHKNAALNKAVLISVYLPVLSELFPNPSPTQCSLFLLSVS